MGAWTIVAFDPTFGSFTLLELVSLVKVFRLFRLEPIFAVFRVCLGTDLFDVQSVYTVVGTCTTSYLLARPACL